MSRQLKKVLAKLAINDVTNIFLFIMLKALHYFL